MLIHIFESHHVHKSNFFRQCYVREGSNHLSKILSSAYSFNSRGRLLHRIHFISSSGSRYLRCSLQMSASSPDHVSTSGARSGGEDDGQSGDGETGCSGDRGSNGCRECPQLDVHVVASRERDIFSGDCLCILHKSVAAAVARTDCAPSYDALVSASARLVESEKAWRAGAPAAQPCERERGNSRDTVIDDAAHIVAAATPRCSCVMVSDSQVRTVLSYLYDRAPFATCLTKPMSDPEARAFALFLTLPLLTPPRLSRRGPHFCRH